MKITVTAIGALAILLAPRSEASLALSITAGNFLDRNGAPVAAGTLFQLVNLGPDGVFTQIFLGDALEGRWVSGDDSVINATLIGDDFPTTAAFDLMQGQDLTPGFMDRVLNLDAGIPPVGTRFGIRWFPGLQATNFANITLAGGQFYGEFTRQTEPNGYDRWVIKGSSGNYTLEPLFTAGLGGFDPESAGSAAHAENVIWGPEPGSLALVFAGSTALMVLRRRRR